MELSAQNDDQILNGLTTWVGKEREAVTHVIDYLQEVESRKLYLKYSSSLFGFLMTVHKYSRHEAQARVDALRLVKRVPEVAEDISAGRLSLTVAAQTQSAFRQEDSRREKVGQQALSEDEQKTVLTDLMSASTREADRKLATHFPNQPPPERVIPISADITRIEFNADSQRMKKFERLQATYDHQTGGNWGKLFELLASRDIEKLDAPSRRARGIQKSKTRYIQKSVNQRVWSKWERGCNHILVDGGRCGSRQNLQSDHIIEFSKGGANTVENLRLLCGAHNRYRSDIFEQYRTHVENYRASALESFKLWSTEPCFQRTFSSTHV